MTSLLPVHDLDTFVSTRTAPHTVAEHVLEAFATEITDGLLAATDPSMTALEFLRRGRSLLAGD